MGVGVGEGVMEVGCFVTGLVYRMSCSYVREVFLCDLRGYLIQLSMGYAISMDQN